MVDLFIDGFDKYGPTNTLLFSQLNTVTTTLTGGNVMLGEWTNFFSEGTGAVTGTIGLVTGRSVGRAVQLTGTNLGSNRWGVYKTLSSNYATLVFGFAFNATLAANGCGFTLQDSGTDQVSVAINTSGQIEFRRGSVTGTLLGTSSTAVTANSWHYLEGQVTINNTTGSYTIYLDGTSVLSASGQNTRSSANNSANRVFFVTTQTAVVSIDDFYIFDTTGVINNAPLLTNPRVETQFPKNDSSVHFSFGAAIIGPSYQGQTTTNAPGANQLFLRQVTATATGTVQSVSCVPAASNGNANFRAVMYTNSSGSPNALLSSGSQVTGTTSGVTLTSSLVSPQTVTIGSSYWIGFITDTSVVLEESDSSSNGVSASNTYSSGAPSLAPAMSTGLPSWIIYGTMTGLSVNFYEVSVNPSAGDSSFVFDSVVGDEDLYQFPTLTSTPAAIYTMAVKGYLRNAAAGTRTVTVQTKSGSTDSSGSSSAVNPSTSYTWIDSFFDTDPNTSSAWTASGLNNAVSGVKIDT